MNEDRQLPIDWASQMAQMANQEAKSEQPEVGSFSFKAGMLTFGGAPIPGSNIDVVVLANVHENRYYPEEYDQNNLQSPVCWARSEDGLGMAPNAELVTKAYSDTCATCEHYQWGTDPKGGRGKACKAVRQFICIAASDLNNIKEAKFATGTISTTNIKYWSNYVNTLAAMHKLPSWAGIVKLTCSPDQNTIVRLGFDLVQPLSEELFPDLLMKREKALEILSLPYTKREEGWDAPKAPGKKRKF